MYSLIARPKHRKKAEKREKENVQEQTEKNTLDCSVPSGLRSLTNGLIKKKKKNDDHRWISISNLNIIFVKKDYPLGQVI